MNEKPATQKNLDAFYEFLKGQYEYLFKNDSGFSFAAARTTPEALARKMTLALDNGSGDKDGKAIVAACKYFKIPHTYKAIRAFFAAE